MMSLRVILNDYSRHEMSFISLKIVGNKNHRKPTDTFLSYYFQARDEKGIENMGGISSGGRYCIDASGGKMLSWSATHHSSAQGFEEMYQGIRPLCPSYF